MYLDNSSFVVNLQKRRDSSFYLCGEVAQYVYQLCFRCYNPDTVPLENSWFLLLNFQVSEGTFMPVDEFLTRLKMTNKVSKASKQKAEGIHSGKRVEKNVIAKTAGTVKGEFVRDGQSYLQFLVGEVLRRAGLSSNLVKGLAAFDPFVMFKRPIDITLRHFDMLYNTFLLRSWVTVTNESACRDEYLGLLDHLRSTYPSSFEITDSSRDLIDFLINLDIVQTHQHLLHLFKLCCLCATSVSPSYPAVTMGSISTSGYQSMFTDVILPCQSYLSSVSDSVAFCSNDTNLNSFSLLSTSFGQSAFSPTYDPWTYVDAFGRCKIYKTLMSACRSATTEPLDKTSVPAVHDLSTMSDSPAVRFPSERKRRKMERSSSGSRGSSVVNESVVGTSKN